MKLSGRWALGLVAGGVLLGSIVSATAQEGTPPPSERPQRKAHAAGVAKRAIRSEAVVQAQDGTFRTVRTDRGELTAIDGGTLTIDEADGTTVRIAVDEGTRIGRDGERAELSDLRTGDEVVAVREKTGDGDFTTRRVVAVSPERKAELQARREACRVDPARCRTKGPRGRGVRPGVQPPDDTVVRPI